MAPDLKIDHGDFDDFPIAQHMGPGIASQYIDVMASNDEICITYVCRVPQPLA